DDERGRILVPRGHGDRNAPPLSPVHAPRSRGMPDARPPLHAVRRRGRRAICRAGALLMSYLLITQDFPPGFIGGIAAWATDLAQALHGAGHDVTVLCRNTKHSRWPDSQQ